jgi:glycosidase
MQWSSAKNGGFSLVVPWMDVNPNHTVINAQEQLNRDDSVLAYYRALIRLRHRQDVILHGSYEACQIENEHVFAYTRTLKDKKLFVCCNFTNQPLYFIPPREFTLQKPKTMLCNVKNSRYPETHALAPYEAIVLLAQEVKPHGATHSKNQLCP